MPAFEYTALGGNGRQQTGVIEGDTPRQARQALRDRGLSPLDIRPVSENKNADGKGFHLNSFIKHGMNPSELALMTRQLSTLVASGTPLEDALGTTARQSEKARVKKILMGVRAKVTEGHSLEAGLNDFPSAFPELYRATVAAGEKSGFLDTVLERLAEYAENRQEMRQKLTGALIYPVILVVFAFIVVAGLLTYVVPQVTEVFTSLGAELPLLTRTLIAISDAAKAYGVYALIAVAGATFLFLRAMRNTKFRYRVHQIILRIPLISKLVRGLNTSGFARTLSILVASGVPVLEALRISAQVMSNLSMREAVYSATINVREGASISNSLEKSGQFPPMTIHLIASGESSGKLENMLERSAIHQERELQSILGAILALFEPVMILVMGVLVMIIVLAILLPIFELNQLIQ